MRKIANQPGLDFTPQEGFAFTAPMDMGQQKPAVCSKGHKMPPGVVVCPLCLDLASEQLDRERHERMVLSAARAILDGGKDAPILSAGVAGLGHFIPSAATAEKRARAFCGELVNTKFVSRKTFLEVDRMPGNFCKKCREFIGL